MLPRAFSYWKLLLQRKMMNLLPTKLHQELAEAIQRVSKKQQSPNEVVGVRVRVTKKLEDDGG